MQFRVNATNFLFISIFFAQCSIQIWILNKWGHVNGRDEVRWVSAVVLLYFYCAEWHYCFLRAEKVPDSTNCLVRLAKPTCSFQGYAMLHYCVVLQRTWPLSWHLKCSQMLWAIFHFLKQLHYMPFLAELFFKQWWRLNVRLGIGKSKTCFSI